MITPLRFHTLDVFTDTPYAGNPLAVVLDAEDLDTTQMQTIAREFNLSETIFVMPPQDPANTARVRIFFPTAEIPFAGHPTLGCAALLAGLRNGAGDFEDRIVLEEEAGLVPVSVRREGTTLRGEFVAPVIPFSHDREIEADLLAKALDLPEDALGFGAHSAGVFEGGPAFLYAPVRDLDALGRSRPVEPHWSALMAASGVDSAYLYTSDGDVGYRARMYSPTAGIPEDPATGSASAILAAQLLAAGALGEGENAVALTQGVEMGRESHITLTACVRDGSLREVRIGGSALRMNEGELTPPPRPKVSP
ncbi:trans-2,3-dihydro-3-hydroxyanthranilate isomerase [Aliiruegeria haliotis]|uniref:Trans-2,3-dihydro-3-hydroxyanthranilate isomerase n=1 Tax=Aliiruegeria haliotis TaxID=1280846 RepID=A0A2T0RRD9_9RHOB|nr:PhzF family phenazine biosynthesis protein [Aliiruegeria haliotis]PRY23738.1 trans-2,3-dihydro-3-hydroxyanthranilate isomerase [Aliiruegeria haliotis]